MTSWPMRGIWMKPQFLPAHVLRHAHPARAVVVLLARAVPEELHLHAAVLVGEDLLAGRADDHRRLRAVHDRFRRHARRPERNRRAESP